MYCAKAELLMYVLELPDCLAYKDDGAQLAAAAAAGVLPSMGFSIDDGAELFAVDADALSAKALTLDHQLEQSQPQRFLNMIMRIELCLICCEVVFELREAPRWRRRRRRWSRQYNTAPCLGFCAWPESDQHKRHVELSTAPYKPIDLVRRNTHD